MVPEKTHFILPSLFLLAAPALHAAELKSSDLMANDYFGTSVSLSGSVVLVGAIGDDAKGILSGSAYLFRDLNAASSGIVTESAKLTASDGAANDNLGYSVSLSGFSGLAGAWWDDSDKGSAYLFRDLDSASGAVTQNVKLTASDGARGNMFGSSVSLSGSSALVGARNNASKGAAYLFRNLNFAPATITQNAKLTASDGARDDHFGGCVSLSGSSAIVAASESDSAKGAAYLFRNLDFASGTTTQHAKLVASDAVAGASFGSSLSLSGSTALVSASGSDSNKGAAYLFYNLNSASGVITENVKLVASDGAAEDLFGSCVSLSGFSALVAAIWKDSSEGAVYLFRDLNSASGTVTESVKLTVSDGTANNYFGVSVSLDGDNFAIGASGKDSRAGEAYTGSVSSMTTLDTGHASRVIDGISFKSREDWIIGQSTDNNTVTLSHGDAANVTVEGKAIYVGLASGSDGNILIISGNLATNDVYIGAVGNVGNALRFDAEATFTIESIYLAPGNLLLIEGDHTADLFVYLGNTDLKAWNDSEWKIVNAGNFDDLLTASFADGYTAVTTVPEPAAWLLLALGAGTLLRRRATSFRAETRRRKIQKKFLCASA